MYKRKFNLLIVSFLVFISIIYFDSLQVKAESNKTQKSNSYIFIVEDGKKYDNILNKLKSVFPNLSIYDIKEINSFSITFNNENSIDNVKNYINNNYEGIVKAEGEEEPIVLNKPNIVNNSTKINKTFEKNKENIVENKSSLDLNSKYEQWRWDIDKVTDNRQSYNIQQGNHKVKVAVIDSGIDQNHPDLKENIIINKTFVPKDNSLQDTLGHGTMVAGEIAADGNVKGVAPKIAIASYKVFKDDNCESSWVIKAIIQAAKDNMDVINLSLGTYKSLLKKDELATTLAYERAILYAELRGCVVVTASGTEEKGIDTSNPYTLAQELGYKNGLEIYLPGGLPDVINVSATNKEDDLAFYSNYGSNVKIAAPGGDNGPDWQSKKNADLGYMALVTYPTNLTQSSLSSLLGFQPGYEFITGGTSLAAPKVSAAAALIILQYENKYGVKPLPSKVAQLLYRGTTSGANGNNPLYYGKGILNVENSLNLIQK